MKQIVSNYSYSPATNVVTLTGVNIDADQLLLIVAPGVGRTLYNFASVTGTVSAGADTRVTLNASTAGLTTTSPLVIFYDDQASTQTVAGTVTANLSSSNLNSVTIGVRGSVTANSNLTATALVDLVEPVRAGVFSWADGELQGIISNSTPVISGTVTVGASSVTFNANVGTRSDGSRHPLSLESGSNYVNARVFSPSVEIFQATVTVGNSVTIGSLPAISGTVTANVVGTRAFVDSNAVTVSGFLTVGGWDDVNSQHAPIPLTDSGTGVRIGFDDANGAPLQVINHPSLPLSATVTVSNSVTIGSLPTISGTVTANAGSGTFNVSNRGATGEATVSNFTSTTSSTLKASNSNRKVLTIYNEGAGNLHVLYGSGTASTTNYSVKLFSGDYLEIDKYTGQVNAIFATAGTARVTEIT
jgi:hypothetical protein